MTLTLTYVIVVTLLSNLQKVLAITRDSLKSYQDKKL